VTSPKALVDSLKDLAIQIGQDIRAITKKSLPVADAPERNLYDRVFQNVTLADFGAYPDGSDCTLAVQRAFSSPYKTIWVPEGIHTISADVTIPSGKTIRGSGRNSVIKLKDGVTSGTNAIYTEDTEDITLLDFRVDGNLAGQLETTHTTCLQMIRSNSLTIRGLDVMGSTIDGVYVYDCDNLNMSNVHSHHNGFAAVDASGFNFDTCRGASLSNLIAHDNGFHGVYISGSSHLTLQGLITRGNTHDGLRCVYSCEYLTLNGVHSFENDRGIYLLGGTYAVSMVGNHLIANRMSGLVLNECYSASISDSFVNGNDGYALESAHEWDYLSACNCDLNGNVGGQVSNQVGSTVVVFHPSYY